MANTTSDQQTQRVTLAGGCFWCLEAIFERVKGVTSVVSGYTGGSVANASYEQVSTGKTGHAESVRITFDPKAISFREILEIFFATHHPTTLDRQGGEVGARILSGGEIPPAILRPALRAAVLPGSHQPQTGKAPAEVRREAES